MGWPVSADDVVPQYWLLGCIPCIRRQKCIATTVLQNPAYY